MFASKSKQKLSQEVFLINVLEWFIVVVIGRVGQAPVKLQIANSKNNK